MRGFMTFAVRFLKFLLGFLGVLFILQIPGMFILAVVLPFISSTATKLPVWLNWYNNATTPINGEDWYIQQNIANGLDPSSWWNRYNWLALRNPVNYFQTVYMGFVWDKQTPVVYDKDTVYNIDQTGGYFYTEVSDGHYQYYYVKPYTIFGSKRCVRFVMGWKIGKIELNAIGKSVQWVFTFNPVMPFNP